MTPYFKLQLGLLDNKTIHLDLSQPQHTGAGYFLDYLYYRAPENWTGISRSQRSGYPHNGGQHTIFIKAPVQNIELFFSWLSSLRPTGAVSKPGQQEFLNIFRQKFLEKIQIS